MRADYSPYAGQGARHFRRTSTVVLLSAIAASALLGILIGMQPALVVLPLVVGAPAIIWHRPYYAVWFLLATALVIENWTYTVGTHGGAFTDLIPWWSSLSHGTILFPVEFFLLIVMLIWGLKASAEGSYSVPKSPVRRWFLLLWVLLLVGVGIGLSHGAQLKYDLWELRCWIYLTVAYLLAGALLRTHRALQGVLWVIVIGTGFKALQGTYIFLAWARAMSPRPEEILGHEEALFFCIFTTLTAALWLYRQRGALRTTATCLLPFVIIADMANARRTAWLNLALSLMTLLAVGWVTLPFRRKFLRRTVAVLLIGSAVYLPLYWNHDNGTLGQAARAVRSQVSPDARDKSSDTYRQQEDVNLILNIKADGLLGRGFGVPIDYALPIANISNIDPMIAYIPHNGILWIWMRLGLQGEIVFWGLISAGIIRACRLAKTADPRLALLGALVASSVVAYTAEGYEDMGFAFFRIAIAMGCLLGMVEAATRIADSNADAFDSRPVQTSVEVPTPTLALSPTP